LETQRPVPWRADSIGPWINALGFLSWLGSLSTAALVYLFSGDGFGPDGTPSKITGWGLLLTMFFSEHIFLALQIGTRIALSKIDSPGLQKERAERFAVRKYVFTDLFSAFVASFAMRPVSILIKANR
jgi:anoctamin-10